jgi:radical SAM protein with 4Fe4S-binding SPASM domain
METTHDAVRGQGHFAVVINNIQLLLDLRTRGEYKGQITIHTVLNKQLIPNLYKYCLFAESLGIDSLYIGYPWHINVQTAQRMDSYVANRLNFINIKSKEPRSWHTYLHRLEMDSLPILKEQLKRINERVWKLRFRFQPALELNDLEDFIAGSEKPAQGKTECYAVSNRMDIRADGTVTSCQCYPELVMGNLNYEDVIDIWHGEKIKKVRAELSKGLMPVCSKCILLYLNGK